MRSRGKAFEEEMRKSIEACGGLVVRIPDAMAFDRQRKVMVGAKTPADFIMVYTRSGRGAATCLLECKATSTNRIEFSQVREHQAQALSRFQDYSIASNGAVAVCFYDQDNPRGDKFCCIVPWPVWEGLPETLGKKSASSEDLANMQGVFWCPRVKGGTYDVKSWLDEMASVIE